MPLTAEVAVSPYQGHVLQRTRVFVLFSCLKSAKPLTKIYKLLANLLVDFQPSELLSVSSLGVPSCRQI